MAPSGSPRKGRTKSKILRVSDLENEIIEAGASAHGMTVSDYVKYLVFKEAGAEYETSARGENQYTVGKKKKGSKKNGKS